jgi:hypothetical protein
MRTLLSIGFVSFCLFSLSGCILEGEKYQIVMKPQKERLHRKITFPVKSSSAERIGRIYQACPPLPLWGKVTLSQTFIGSIPNDIGGFGTYTFFETSMGDFYAYSERIGGSDEIVQNLTRLHQAQDKCVDFLIGWFKAELEKEPGFEKLRKFLNENLRQDIKNLTMYAWLRSFNSKDEHNPEMVARAAQYLVEHGYFQTKELPALYHAGMGLGENEDYGKILLVVRKFVAEKMGYLDTQKMPPCLEFLSNPDRLMASLSKYAVTTEEYKKQLKEWQKEKKDNSDDQKPDPLRMVAELALDASGFDLHLFSDTLDINFACPTQPYATNGKWDKHTLAISWSVSLAEEKYGLPEFCYAAWSVPNEKFQKDHFGQVIFRDETLAEYCLWRNGLNKNQAREWDNFLLSLRPGKNLPEKLNAFHFSDEPKPNPGSPKPAGPAATWINHFLAALQPTTTQSSQPEKNDTFFSDTLERILYDPNSGKAGYIGFRTGQLLAKLNDIGQSEAWLRENSVDAGVVFAKSRQWLLFYDMVIFPIESSRWETMTLSEFRKILPVKGFILKAATMKAIEPPFPQTYVFRNRTGDVGLLQVLSIVTADPLRSVQIRYKLVRPQVLDQAQSTTKPKPKVL